MPAVNARLFIKRGREKPIIQRHPWIFSGAIAGVEGHVDDGGIADIVDDDGAWLARAYVNRASQIAARVLTWREDEAIDEAFWRDRIAKAVARRQPLPAACRLVHGEGDGLPGFIADRYGDVVVIQALALGIERVKPILVDALREATGAACVYERSDTDARGKEGLDAATGVLAGDEPPALIELDEPGPQGARVPLLVDVRRGHKTGAYLDQRDNRRLVGERLAGADVLDVFAYTGGFAAHALAAGAARVVCLDGSADALTLARRTIARAGHVVRDEDFVQGDAFRVLRTMRDLGTSFDAVIVDPPKLAASGAQVERAARGYKDLVWLAFRLLRPGGLVATFSCSGHVDADLFQKIAFSGAVDAGKDALILSRLQQPPDHPVRLGFPEGWYLKGLLLRAVDEQDVERPPAAPRADL